MSAVTVASAKSGEISVLTVTGTIDGSSAPDAQAAILPEVQPGCRLVLDLAGVEYMSSAGLRVMLQIYRQAASKGGKVVLAGLPEEIKDTMSLTGFLDFFKTSDTVAGALVAVNG